MRREKEGRERECVCSCGRKREVVKREEGRERERGKHQDLKSSFYHKKAVNHKQSRLFMESARKGTTVKHEEERERTYHYLYVI